MNVLIPVGTTAAQMQHVLILLEAITVPSCDSGYTGDGISCKGMVVNRRVYYGESIAIL